MTSAYETFAAEEEARHERECGAEFVTPGPDPWGFTCDQDKGHYPATDHSMANPMGDDTPTFTWRSR